MIHNCSNEGADLYASRYGQGDAPDKSTLLSKFEMWPTRLPHLYFSSGISFPSRVEEREGLSFALSFHVANADGYQCRVNTRGSWDPQQLIVQTCQEGATQPATSRAPTSPTALPLCRNSLNQLGCSGKFSCHIIPCSFPCFCRSSRQAS